MCRARRRLPPAYFARCCGEDVCGLKPVETTYSTAGREPARSFYSAHGGVMFGAGIAGLEHGPGRIFPLHKAGKSLWRLWKGPAEAPESGVDAQRAELRAPEPPQFLSGGPVQLCERLAQLLAEQPRCLVGVVVRSALGLGDDRVDHAQLEAVRRVRLERLGRLAGL